MNKYSIVIAPNEDGLGTSAWTVRLAKELYRQTKNHGDDIEIRVIYATEERERFHSNKYEGFPIKPIKLEDILNPIKLIKRGDGSVNIEESIKELIMPYDKSRRDYQRALQQQSILENINMVIDLGVPQITRAVYQENQKRSKPIKMATVFDHAWGLTLRKIFCSDPESRGYKQTIENTLQDIENDESLTMETFLFPEPIAPADYHGYWKKLLGHFPKVIDGTLDGPLSTLSYMNEDISSYLSTLERGNKLPEEIIYKKGRDYAKQLLEIENDDLTLHISGGGTGVWNELIEKIIGKYKEKEPNYNVVIYSPIEAKKLGKATKENKVPKKKEGRITFIGSTYGETHGVIYPAFDAILTRAGGGTVNRAIALRVPLVLIEEEGMWQVEQIRKSCLNMQLIEGDIILNKFKGNPREYIETEDGGLKTFHEQKQKMSQIPYHSEISLVTSLLKMLDK